MTDPYALSETESLWDKARELGERLGGEPWVDPLDTIDPIASRILYPTNKGLWPADEWERMQRIRRGEED